MGEKPLRGETTHGNQTPQMIDQTAFYVAAIPAVLIAGISKGGFGGGIGVMSVPLMVLVIPPTLAAAIMLPILCFMDLFSLWIYRGKQNSSYLRIMIPAAIVGIVIGALGFRFLDDGLIRLLVGCIALWFTASVVIKALRPPPTNRAVGSGVGRGLAWSGVAGFTSFMAHAGGPPVQVYLLRENLDKTTYQATTVVFFTAVNYIKVIPYGMLGQFQAESLAVSVTLLPLALVDILLGAWLHNRVNDRLFFRICYVFLFFTGLKLVGDGLASF